MAKTKEIVKAPISFEGRHQVHEVVLPLVNEILGTHFDDDLFLPAGQGVALNIANSFERYFGLRPTEHHWEGAVIKLYFRNADYREVSRKLKIPTTGEIDAAKLRAKWNEILALKAKDDELRAKRKAAISDDNARIEALLSEAEALGVDRSRFDRSYATATGFAVELSGVTPAQLKAIAEIMAG
jgi:hypothetical protein